MLLVEDLMVITNQQRLRFGISKTLQTNSSLQKIGQSFSTGRTHIYSLFRTHFFLITELINWFYHDESIETDHTVSLRCVIEY